MPAHAFFFFCSSRRRHTRFDCDWSSDVCSSDLAASTRMEPYRPWFLGVTVVLLGIGFVSAYRREPECADDTCAPTSRRNAKIILWIAVVAVGLLAAFPYYMRLFL